MLVFQTYNHPEKVYSVLACLGYIAQGTNQFSEAQDYFYRGLGVAVKETEIMALAHTLPGIVIMFSDLGDGERAIEIYTLASTLGIVANSRWFLDIAGDEIATLAVRPPAAIVEAAKGRVRAAISWETDAELLVELEELGWYEPVPSDSTV